MTHGPAGRVGDPAFRAPMHSRLAGTDHAAAVGRALDLGVCGIGGRLDRVPRSWPEAVGAVEAAHGERVARRLQRFGQAPDGAEVWARDGDGRFHRGVLDGPWCYDADPEAWAVDLTHVRRCWWAEPLDPQHAPAAVVATYERGGRNFQRIHA